MIGPGAEGHVAALLIKRVVGDVYAARGSESTTVTELREGQESGTNFSFNRLPRKVVFSRSQQLRKILLGLLSFPPSDVALSPRTVPEECTDEKVRLGVIQFGHMEAVRPRTLSDSTPTKERKRGHETNDAGLTSLRTSFVQTIF